MSGTIVDDDAVPPGLYTLSYVDYRTTTSYGVGRVVVRFRIADVGPYFDQFVERWYRVKALRGKEKKFGNFLVSRRSDLYREHVAVFGKVNRGDRLSFAGLKGKAVLAEVRTVKVDHQQRDLSPELQYSVVDRLVGLA